MKILVLDDDVAHTNFICLILRQHEHEVYISEDGARAVRFLETSMVDLVILDWNVPVISGLDVLRWIRRNIGYNIPVLFLTNRVFEQQIAEALNAGADDYVAKPVGKVELLARINALTRRLYRGRELSDTISTGNYIINAKEKSIFLNGARISLTQKEYEIASILFMNLGYAVPRDYLIKLVWGKSSDMLSRSLDTHVYRVRKKLSLYAENGVTLKSIYATGYRLDKA
ncbi:response regulator transcription factor [Burkholderia savannae]|uniref:response regulator transcription factor n=1 Tax=Burkholderia savannae TaxID=1637837 RepID=UPI000AEB82DB|nr:response regulator transcription factor [Burkholderia savannae]